MRFKKHFGEAYFHAKMMDRSEIHATLYSNGGVGFHSLPQTTFEEKCFFAFMGTSIHFLQVEKEPQGKLEILTSAAPNFRFRYRYLLPESKDEILNHMKDAFGVQKFETEMGFQTPLNIYITEESGVKMEIIFTKLFNLDRRNPPCLRKLLVL